MNTAALLESFKSRRVLVIGDAIVDIHTDLERIKDDDTGKPTYRTILDERAKADHYSIGGAGLVVRNLLELGAHVDWVTAFGYGQGALFASTWSHSNLLKIAVQVGCPQTAKHRFRCNGEKVLQVDTVDPSFAVDAVATCLISSIRKAMERADVVVVADYRHGLILESTAKAIVLMANELAKPLYVSSQVAQSGSNHHWYKGACIVANQTEMKSNVIFDDITPAHVFTAGSMGSYFVSNLGTLLAKAGIKVDVVDTCGAGDAFLAAYCLTNDLKFANTWAGLSCEVRGANPPTRKRLIEYTAPRGQLPQVMAFCV